MNSPVRYRFGRYVVDPRLRQLVAGDEVLDVQPKAFDLLLYLIRHRDRVIDKEELLTKLWPGVVVSDSALNQALRKARAMVGDDGSRQRIIETIQRRGFRFVAEVDETGAATQSTSPSTDQTLPSVAVLPFTDMSPAKDQEYFCDGMTEEVIAALTRTTRLKVAARTSVFALKNRADDVREIGRQLGVATLVEGSVRRSGNRLRVTSQLVDAKSGFQLWSDRWDRDMQDMLAVQDEIAACIAAALRAGPAADGEHRAQPDAAEFCRRGLAYVHRFGRRSQRFAQELFKQALALDDHNARAWAGMALSHMLLYRYSDATDERMQSALEAAQRAVELDPSSADAWTAKGAAATICCDFETAEADFQRAIELAPTSFEAHYYYGRACTETGAFEKAIEHYEIAASLHPEDYQSLTFAVQCYRSLGRHEEADAASTRLLAAGRRALEADPTDARALSLVPSALISAGEHVEAREWLRRALALEPDEPSVLYNSACGFVLLGELEHALDLLEQIDLASMSNRSWMQHDTELDPLREDPRFKAIFAHTR